MTGRKWTGWDTRAFVNTGDEDTPNWILLSELPDSDFMTRQKQANCQRCGATLAVKNDPLSFSENFAMGVLVVLTCGLGLVFVIPYAIFAGWKASKYHCQRCGGVV